jgi:hypothetical protein
MFKFLFLSVFFLLGIFSGCFSVIANQDQFVLSGDVDIVGGTVTFDGKWRQETNAEQSEAKEGTEIEVSISNCAGYLATAKMVYVWQAKWKAQVIPETIASDAQEKVKFCKYSPKSNHNNGLAFAVIKYSGNSKNTKLENLDLRKTFLSLPSNVQSWANCAESLVPEDCVRKEKNTLSLSTGDNWADTDCNGEIDLVLINGNCNNSGDYTCGKTLKWNGLIWIEIAHSTPA